VRLALARPATGAVTPRWSPPAAPADALPSDPAWAGGTVCTDARSADLPASPAQLWPALEQIMARPGFGRPRRRTRLRTGDRLGRWRVERLEPGRLLRLRTETAGPGRTWLEARLAGHAGGCRYEQRLVFLPRGLLGRLYWHAAAPVRRTALASLVRDLRRSTGRAGGQR
jgi:hypothetical protein